MGLDMYLEVESFINGYEWSSNVERYNAVIKAAGLSAVADPNTPHANLSVTAAYWRKANAIHNWFVENVQDGRDECQRSYVTREQLRELQAACRKVLDAVELVPGKIHTGTSITKGEVKQHFEDGQVLNEAAIKVAEEVLPTTSGFFFGSTDYNEWYVEELRDTISQIDRVLENAPDSASLYYTASW